MESPSKPLKQPRARATRKAIMRVAEEMFAQVGFAAVRLEDVAAAVGIKRPSIVYHFPSKRELHDAVESDIFGAMHATLDTRLTNVEDPFERLIALLDAWLDFMVERPSAARIIVRFVADTPPRANDPVRYAQLVLNDIDTIIADGVASGAFRNVTGTEITNGVASTLLFYVCNGQQVGDERVYDASDPATLARFRTMLHRTAGAAVLRSGAED